MGVSVFNGGSPPARGRTFGGGEFVSPTSGGKFPGRSRSYQTAINGGSAGNHTVTGITTADDLVGVMEFASGVPTDRTAEFTISAADTINNTGGTDTTGDRLVVTYTRRGNYDLAGLTFPANEDTKAAVYLEAPISWPSVKLDVLVLGESFGSGTVRFGHGDTDTEDVVEVEVAGFYEGLLNFPTGPGWAPGTGAYSDLQLVQLPICRIGSHANDDLEQGIVIAKIRPVNGG